MQITRLELTNFRVFEHAEFEFKPGMNLIVGTNGAGKSTVLDIIRLVASRWMPGSIKDKVVWNRQLDISAGQEFFQVRLHIGIDGNSISETIFLSEDKIIPNPDALEGQVRDAVYDMPVHNFVQDTTNKSVVSFIKQLEKQLLAVYYSPHRVIIDAVNKPVGRSASKGTSLSLEKRGLNLSELANWWLAQEALILEQRMLLFPSSHMSILSIIEDALHSFLQTYGKIVVTSDSRPTLQIQKNNEVLNLSQLSDGERSIIAIVVDLARRLALTHSDLSDPLRQGEAIVLIDELDLHLHPAWQRVICERLTTTFPNCQFIATTHSPQIIGEVEPDRILIIENGKVTSPDQSEGMESGWILRELMGVSSRSEKTREILKLIEVSIEKRDFSQAKNLISELHLLIPDDPELARLQTRLNVTELMIR